MDQSVFANNKTTDQDQQSVDHQQFSQNDETLSGALNIASVTNDLL